MSARSYGQYCGVATAVDLVGERWALLIVRDLLVGARRYSDLKEGLPRIPTNILSARLKELQAAGIVRRVPFAHGLIYTLTEFGQGLEDVILALGRWGFHDMGEPAEDDVITPDSMSMTFRTAFRPVSAETLPPTIYDTHLRDFSLRLEVDRAALHVTRLDGSDAESSPAGRPRLAFETGPSIHKLISGDLTPAEALRRREVAVLTGDANLLDRFATTFNLRPAA
ncbi:DNA-binding HxlR family transcriptional regulator [Cryobacterium mesophilum]|uniref:Transcriptional regulator n=1 Tax=Terrimesophilobacter mesophilus TaxID=433647 RepID=A0A4R8VAX1_9MICO|nr:helix-turn-helix domain-containing protein [Terrimesophilobacter mesophilus]MBB5633674.1 DNA-binding HxlR family transcriptional regulator [Terrimesophilobacter mesophilus]TFB80364.1 transcriptional regulator [Terrimesophilobacter mesophilus]